MRIFKDFESYSLFTIAILAAALLAGIAALIWKKRAKTILTFWAGAEFGLLAGMLMYISKLGALGGEAFEGIELSAALYSLAVTAIAAAMLVIMIITGRREKWDARQIATAAMCVAMSFVLSCIKLIQMPQGGSITPASLLPLMLYICAFGPARGLVVGFAYGLLQLVQGAYVVHIAQLLLDYPLAFGALALGGFVRNMKLPERLKLPLGVIIGFFGRYIMHVLSGAIFFASYAGEKNVWIYTLAYNISYLGFDALACTLVACVPGMTRLTRMLRSSQ